jgi:hypothetical protein
MRAKLMRLCFDPFLQNLSVVYGIPERLEISIDDDCFGSIPLKKWACVRFGSA